MKLAAFVPCLSLLLWTAPAAAQDLDALKKSLTLHASFDKGLDADFSTDDAACYMKQGANVIPCTPNDDVKLVSGAGRFGGAIWFPKKGNTRPQFKGTKTLNYNDKSWSATVSGWLRISPDQDLEPGYCDPFQIVGDDNKKGYIFCEWSKDETPRYFRYAIRPLFHIWNPTNVQWADIPFEKRPMVQVDRAPFSREAWTHVVFSLENLNDKSKKPIGKLYLNGKLQGSIENWDLTFAWDPAQVWLVLGASYVGYIDDLAVFNRALTDAEVRQVFELKNGVADLRSSGSVSAAAPQPPAGFRAIFNGKDLTGWYGLNPHDGAKLEGEKREANRKKQREDFAKNWTVENGELVNDGHGPYATTDEEFGDIELLIEYKTVPKADSGIYLRGTPQVQIWDNTQPYIEKNPTRRPHLGSGGLFNNTPDKLPGRDPLVNADKPFGEWNAFRIKQVGARTWVWLNDKLVVDGAVMENYWDRSKPLPAKGPIMLQTHGGEIRWRNIFVREIPADEAEKLRSS